MESNESTCLLKMVQRLKSAGRGEANGVREDTEVFMGVGEDHTVSFDFKDISGLTVEGVDLGAQDKLLNGTYLPDNHGFLRA